MNTPRNMWQPVSHLAIPRIMFSVPMMQIQRMVHFRWMKEYGIDGVFVQRFGSDFGVKNFLNTVLTNCKNAANAYQPQVCYDV